MFISFLFLGLIYSFNFSRTNTKSKSWKGARILQSEEKDCEKKLELTKEIPLSENQLNGG